MERIFLGTLCINFKKDYLGKGERIREMKMEEYSFFTKCEIVILSKKYLKQVLSTCSGI